MFATCCEGAGGATRIDVESADQDPSPKEDDGMELTTSKSAYISPDDKAQSFMTDSPTTRGPLTQSKWGEKGFIVELTRSTSRERWGFTLDVWHNFLQVISLPGDDSTAVADYNDGVEKGERIRKSTIFVQVGKHTEPLEMLQYVKERKSIRLRAIQPERLSFMLDKSFQPIGAKFKFQPKSHYVQVISIIEGGLVEQHNQTKLDCPEEQLLEDDLIVSANGVTALSNPKQSVRPQLIAEEVENAGLVLFKVLRA